MDLALRTHLGTRLLLPPSASTRKAWEGQRNIVSLTQRVRRGFFMVEKGTSLHCHYLQYCVLPGLFPTDITKDHFCPSAPARHMARLAAGHSTACAATQQHKAVASLDRQLWALLSSTLPYKLLMSTKPDLRMFPHQHHHRRIFSTRAKVQKSNTKWQQLVANTQHLTQGITENSRALSP